MKTTNFWIILIIHLNINLVHSAIDPDETRTFRELVESRGFKLQDHQVTTEDGYILTIHRVVPQDFNPTNYSRTRKPVIAFHGYSCQSNIFFINSPFLKSNNSKYGDTFGFGLVLTGRYDLWVPNARGNGVSMAHSKLKVTSRKFWEFSLDEIGQYDLSAVIDYVRRNTGHQTVGFVGWSQGGATPFILLSLRPQYAAQIRPLIGWAPSVYLNHSTTGLRIAQLIRPLLALFPGEQLILEFSSKLSRLICRPALGTQGLCRANYEFQMGYSDSLNETRIPVYSHFYPNPASRWQTLQMLQQMSSGRFSRFQYPSSQENFDKYQAYTAPDYPMQNIPANFTAVIMHGLTDTEVVTKDVLRLVETLRTVGANVIDYEVPQPVWSHFDFVASINAGKFVYDKTIEYLDKFSVMDQVD